MVSSKITNIHVVGEGGPLFRSVEEAAAAHFPKSAVHAHRNCDFLEEKKGKGGGEIIVLVGQMAVEAGRLAEVLDESGLPRWPILVIGSGEAPRPVETIVCDSPDARLVGQGLVSAVRLHQLWRENARLRGDLLTMASRVSHDLKTPLNGILATAEAMKEVLQEKHPASTTLAGSLFSSVDELVRLMNRVNFMLKASARASPPTKTFPMGEVVWAVLQRLESKIHAKRLRVKNPADWPEVEGVEAWAEVIWVNLFWNVLEHGGEPTEIDLGWKRREHEYVFWIGDDGKGLNPRRHDNLLRPFHQLHLREAGHGLGLAIVQRLVHLQGGSLSFQPLADGGTRFSFTLPAPTVPASGQ